MLQLFNEINCKKLELTEWNVFKGFCANQMFVGILIITFIIQILFIEIGGEMMKCSNLTLSEHLFCMLFGVIGLVTAIIVRIFGGYLMKKKIKKAKKDDDKYPLITKI